MKGSHWCRIMCSLVMLLALVAACGSTPEPQVIVREVTREIVREVTVPPESPTEMPEPKEEPADSSESSATGEPTSEPAAPLEPTSPPLQRTRLVLYHLRSSYTDYRKLEGLAFVNGFDFEYITDQDQFLDTLSLPDVKAVIYAEDSISDRILYELSDFVTGGGRLFLMYGRWERYNDLLQDLFQISLVGEDVVAKSPSIRYEKSMLPDWISDNEMVVVHPSDKSNLKVVTYMVTPVDGGDKRYLASQESGSDRLMYFMYPDESVIFWPRIWKSDEQYRHMDFLEDANIDFLDNEAAALRLLTFLSK